jgi:cyclase
MFAHRTFRLTSFVLPLILIIGIGTCSEAQDFDKAQIKTEKIKGDIFLLIGPGGNIGVSAGKESVLLIDDQYAPLTDKLKAAIAVISNKPIQFVINTHWHQDHTSGNENLRQAGAIIVAHENVRKRLSTEQVLEAFKMTIPPSPKAALPVITFTQDMTFHLNGDEIYVFHPEPAHTDGDAIIYFRKSNVIHLGDIFFNGMYPFIDTSAGGSIDGMIAAVARVLQICNAETKVIPGHGPVSDKAGLEGYRKMLVTVRDRIARQIKEGKTIDEVVASQPTQDFDPALGGGFLKPELFVQIVYSSLINEGKKGAEKRPLPN